MLEKNKSSKPVIIIGGGLSGVEVAYTLSKFNIESMIYEKRDVIYQKRISLDTDEVVDDLFAPEYRRVYSADYLNQEEINKETSS